jgi:hypothetical protein
MPIQAPNIDAIIVADMYRYMISSPSLIARLPSQ